MIATHKGQAAAYGGYMPTPTDIQRTCQEIQATWSRRERMRRTVERRGARWDFPAVTLTDLLQAVSEARQRVR
jgi:hypothetical protein